MEYRKMTEIELKEVLINVTKEGRVQDWVDGKLQELESIINSVI